MGGGMGGMMGGGQVPNLKNLDSAQRVQQITYCKDTYTITTANGQTRKFWERNLRLKTDASGATIKVVAGVVQPDAGVMTFDGRAVQFATSPADLVEHFPRRACGMNPAPLCEW